MNNEERKKRICKVIVLVLGILSINNIILTIRNYSYAYFHKTIKSDIKLKITTLDEMPSTLPAAAKSVLNKAKKATCDSIIKDDDGTIYFSGTNDCINFNYVWYSGKLWRIVTINPDGSMKLVTDELITAINWGADSSFYNSKTRRGSYIYQWLNEDFKDTLYNYENIIITNTLWNATETTTTLKPDETTIVTTDVGLLNAYEYNKSHENISDTNGYLNIGYEWWLLTPSDTSSYVRFVNARGGGYDSYNSSSSFIGVRPSIVLKADITFDTIGDGSKNNPYKINGDKVIPKVNEKINTRLSGEYVEVDNKKYRIVGIENNTTKLVSIDCVKDENGDPITKKLSLTTQYGIPLYKDEYWDYYLNNNWITDELRKYITEGTYYLGNVNEKTINGYKNTICSGNSILATKTCSKTTITFPGLVGLLRMGEMFAAPKKESAFFIITPYSTYSSGTEGSMWVMGDGIMDYHFPPSVTLKVYPTINLKPEVIIKSGDGMTPDTAFEISL